MNTEFRRHVLDVDSRGRVSLARLGFKSMHLVADELEDGSVVLRPAVVLTDAEARHYADPEAVPALQRGLAQRHDARPHQLRSDPD